MTVQPVITTNHSANPITPFWRWWFVLQGGLFTWLSLAALGGKDRLLGVAAGLAVALIESLLLYVATRTTPHNIILRLLYATNILLQIYTVPFLIANMTNVVLRWLDLRNSLVATIVLAGLLALGAVLHIPCAMVLLAPLRSLWTRGIVAIVSFDGVVGASTGITDHLSKAVYPAVWRQLLDTGLYGALLLVLVGAIAMYQWGYRGPSWRFNPRAQWWVLTIAAVIILYFIGQNSFGGGDSFKGLVVWQFQLKAVNFTSIAEGLRAGIAEEWLYRYIVLALLLHGLHDSRWQIGGSVFLCGFLFGVWHLDNASVQPLLATLDQVQFAIITGWLIAALYLYTGSFIVPVAFHAGLDILAIMASGTTLSSTPTFNQYLWGTIVELTLVLLTVWLLTGRRKDAMTWTVDNIVPGNTLHFSTPFIQA
ncbi:CPBP family intramembrane glutamic endopeptidase [Schleiferilactobacillus perolens]|jgi:hypothetical protein|uniref:CPBP family intramembrane glutamic endopeptidase n=1 Tax=Schleiferilactobacillus perolens TaxID=100468 RepID=UPI0023520028|nr:CPBP family intramembrane glutamic endopeptidase [Schleiferilactobacillus perolens]MCI2171325.1 CPBP family intramembrane metalloprotease [Schleiferilactobacillus perolens]